MWMCIDIFPKKKIIMSKFDDLNNSLIYKYQNNLIIWLPKQNKWMKGKNENRLR